MKRSKLALAIQSLQWADALKLTEEKPELALRWSVLQGFFEGLKDARVLPLHQACAVNGVSLPLIHRLLQIHPQAIHYPESSYQRLPLHCACRTAADPAVIQSLLQAEKQLEHLALGDSQCLQPDMLQRLPLHYALSNGAQVETIRLLLQASPRAAAGVDRRGWTPLHVATSVGCSLEVLKMVYSAYPPAIERRTLQGSTPSQCLHRTVRHRKELKDFLRSAKVQYENAAVPESPQRNAPSKASSFMEFHSPNVDLLAANVNSLDIHSGDEDDSNNRDRSASHDGTLFETRPLVMGGEQSELQYDDLPINRTSLV